MNKLVTHSRDNKLYNLSLCLVAALLLSLFVGDNALANDSSTPTHYSSKQKHRLAVEIARELRCPMAVNQSLFDSQSKIASELKGQIFLMLDEGKSKTEIIDFMVVRYGEKIRYMPPLNNHTLLLWLLPILLVMLAIVGVYFFIRSSLAQQKNNQERPHGS